ncbi:universal stress protein [Streptomyces sp. NPDC059909]|uniref:universal stress protein n=1 Tax=Streptomyces sp. NPDC059909 TaxID=3346998 RepID=UPI0036490DD5
MPHHVTVGLDGSPESSAAAEWAAREALLREVPLRLVHADEWPVSAAIPVAGPDVRRRWADELLAAAAEELRQEYPSLEISTRRLSGRPAAALSIEAAEADLLVLGSRGLSGVMGFLLGSVGMETIGATERPVVLVRAPGQPGGRTEAAPEGRFGGVVVGVDIHHSCDPLLDFAFDEAARRGVRLRAVYGWSLPPFARDASALAAAEREMSPDIARRLTHILAPWRQKFPSVEVVERSPIGAPSQLLVHAAADAELAVVGRRIRRSPLGAHIGSVAHAVIHHCAAPVAVVAHD